MTGETEDVSQAGGTEAFAGVVLYVLASMTLAFATSTGAALVYSQWVNAAQNIAIRVAVVTLSTGVLTVIQLFLAVMLVGVVGAVAWPTIGERNEYFILGMAGVTGGIVAFATWLFRESSTLNLLGGPIPLDGSGFTSLLLVGLPTALLLSRLTVDANQPNSMRPSEVAKRQSESSKGPKAWTSNPKLFEPGMTWTGPGDSPDSPEARRHRSDPQQPSNELGSPTGHCVDGQAMDFDDLQYNWQTETEVSMEDVGGMEDLKAELRQDVILPLTSGRELAEEMDIPLPNILFHGPPGTGKTYIAKALATELGLPFVKLSGANIQSKWINESAGNVKALFEEAGQIAESEGGAVVFIDEIDSVLKSRDTLSGHDEDQKVTNEFLNHLQESRKFNVLVVGATNRLEALDEAAIRAGRFDEKFHIGQPDLSGRSAIIEAQLSGRPHVLTDDQIDELAHITEGYTAADLESLVVDAARHSAFVREGDEITWSDISAALPDGE